MLHVNDVIVTVFMLMSQPPPVFLPAPPRGFVVVFVSSCHLVTNCVATDYSSTTAPSFMHSFIPVYMPVFTPVFVPVFVTGVLRTDVGN